MCLDLYRQAIVHDLQTPNNHALFHQDAYETLSIDRQHSAQRDHLQAIPYVFDYLQLLCLGGMFHRQTLAPSRQLKMQQDSQLVTHLQRRPSAYQEAT